MNNIQLFKNEEFGYLRTIEIDGEPWFVGKDVAAALGYGKTRNAIAAHVDDEDKKEAPIQGVLGGTQEMTIINESGLYNLIFSSKLSYAKKFKHWVTSEVLPALRKYGTYGIPGRIPEISPSGLAELIRITRRGMLDNGRTSQEVEQMIRFSYQTWGVPVPPPLEIPTNQLSLFDTKPPLEPGSPSSKSLT